MTNHRMVTKQDIFSKGEVCDAFAIAMETVSTKEIISINCTSNKKSKRLKKRSDSVLSPNLKT